MKKITLLLFILMSLFIVSCQDSAPQAAAVPPTEEPTAEPTGVSSELEAEAGTLESDSATNEETKSGFQPRYEPLDECFVSPPEDLEVAVDYDCGFVVVPEFYKSESTREVKVPFLRFNSGQGTAASPVLLHPGGPGGSHIEEFDFSLLNIMFKNVISDRDVIFMNPRGTEYADTFLDCPAFYSLDWQAYEQGLDQEAAQALSVDTLQQCIDEFKAQGVNLSAYNSLELAGDVNSVRQALGYEQIIYFGTSYGSQLGQHIMRDYPEILESVILNGSAPLSRKSWIEYRALDSQAAFDNLVALCVSDEKCNAAYPDIPGLLDAALAHFKDGPLPFTYTDPNDPSLTIEGEVGASDLAELIFSMEGNKNSVFTVLAILNTIAPADQTEAIVEILGETAGQNIIGSRDLTKGEMAILTHLAVVCSDDPVKSEDEIVLDGASEFADYVAHNAASMYILGCSLVDVQELPDGTDENVTTDVPTLMLSGSLDVATPPFSSEKIVEALPNVTHVIFPGHTHDQLGGLSLCVSDVFTQFIADPSVTLDTSCLETPDYVGFLLPDGSFSLGVVPEADPEQAETGAESTLPDDVTAQLDAFLQSQVYTEGGDPTMAAPGLVLLVDTPDGRYLNAVGAANLEDGTPMQVDDVLQIGSNTKSMTIVLLMQLVEEGILTLEDPLSQWLPEQAAILPNGDQITIRQLANHISGIWDYGDPIIGAGLDDPILLEKGYTPAELVEYAAENGTPDFAPGEAEKWKYSNTGYILLGMILEEATGEPYRNLLQTRIFDPLGMESATLIEDVPTLQETSTRGYVWNKAGEMIDGTNWNGSQGWSAGSVSMTAADLATYGHSLASGQFFHNPETLAEMLTFNPDANDRLGGGYGLGLMDFAGDGSIWGHEGATFAFQSLWYTEPDAGIVVIGLTNSGSYSAFSFLNVLNILEGDGPLPVSPGTLLPFGGPTQWQWVQFVSPTESTDIDETTVYRLVFSGDQTSGLFTPDCGVASGAYTVAGTGNIDLELDGSTLTCEADSLAAQAVQHLNDAAKWQVENGRLLIELPMDGGTFVFKTYVSSITPPSTPTDEGMQNWRWVSLLDADNNETTIDEEGTYNLTMIEDQLILGTGCRVAFGSFETGDNNALSLTFDIPEKTDASCVEGPSADQFYELLQATEGQYYDGKRLYISLMNEGGVLIFEPLEQPTE